VLISRLKKNKLKKTDYKPNGQTVLSKQGPRSGGALCRLGTAVVASGIRIKLGTRCSLFFLSQPAKPTRHWACLDSRFYLPNLLCRIPIEMQNQVAPRGCLVGKIFDETSL
jgi:hypothetical protein